MESVMLSNHLILCHPLLLPLPLFPSIRVFSNESALHTRWLKYWHFSFNISLFNEHSGLISFRMDWIDLLVVQGTLKSLLQHHSSKVSILLCSAFFIVQLLHPYMTAAAAKSLQLCPTLCDPIDVSPPGSPIPGILQARTLEWVAISFSKAWKWKVKVKSLSLVRLFVTPWTTAYQAPLSMGFSRQEYWSGLPLPSLPYMTIGMEIQIETTVKKQCVSIGMGFPGDSEGKNATCNKRDLGSIPDWGNPLEEVMAIHSSILAWRIPMDRVAWWATIHRVTKSQTRLND